MQPFKFRQQTQFYQGKVRDVYTIKNEFLVIITTDRISAFDVILPKLIPYKGQVLNELAAFMLHATQDICANWLLTMPTPIASIGNKCKPFIVEVVVRGNLCGHAWRTYNNGQRFLCGQLLPDNLVENDFFPKPIITPSTKAIQGHDEDISIKEIINSRLVSEHEWQQIEAFSLALFERGNELAKQRGLVLADTKYEFGTRNGEVVLMDEIHTPDSSRYFYAEGFEERQQKKEKQKQLSKEFVREWLIENDFMGKEDQIVPEMDNEWVNTISKRYIALFEKITGQTFKPQTINEKQNFELINEALSKFIV